MNTRQLQYVLAVAEEQSFTKAAKKLIIAQPSLSQYIGKLEQDLGHELFDRSETPLRPTPAGEIYIEAARKILGLEQRMEKRLRDMDDQQYGRLVIGAIPYLGLCTLPEAARRFLIKYPNYELIFREQKNRLLRKLMDNGELDICITLLPVDETKYGHVRVHQNEELLVAIPERSPINNTLSKACDASGSGYPTIDLGELREESFITPDERSLTYRTIYDLCWQAGFRPRIVSKCVSGELCRRLAAKGVGVTILPSMILEYEDNRKGLKLYRLRSEYEKQAAVAIYRKNSYLSSAAKDFLEILTEK